MHLTCVQSGRSRHHPRQRQHHRRFRETDRHASRVGYDLLSRIGLNELAASDAESYIATAAGLAADLPRLAQIRREVPNVAIIIMTSDRDDADAARSKLRGTLALLKKPFYPADVDAVLERYYGLHQSDAS